MHFSIICSIVAAVAFAVSSIYYVADTASTKIKPSIATFSILSLVNLSQLIALVSKHVWHVIPFTTIGLLQALAVCVLAIRGGRFYFKLADKVALVGALIGFLVWLLTKNAAYNIYIINAVTTITFLPLIIKSFKAPTLETRKPWLLNLVASLFLLGAINGRSPVIWIVPVRQFTCSLLINIGLFRGKTANR